MKYDDDVEESRVTSYQNPPKQQTKASKQEPAP
jgi:hypothetical protein